MSLLVLFTVSACIDGETAVSPPDAGTLASADADVCGANGKVCIPPLPSCATSQVPADGGCVSIGPACSGRWAASPDDPGCVPTRECASGTLLLDGDCVTIGPTAACIDTPPQDGVPTYWVSPTSPAAGADGTSAHPFPTIAAAVAGAQPGGRVWLTAAEYQETVEITSAIRLEGECAERTILRPSPGREMEPVVRILDAEDIQVRRLSIRGGRSSLRSERTRNVVVEDVDVGESVESAVNLRNADTVVVRRALVRDVRPPEPHPADAPYLTGIVIVDARSSALVERSRVEASERSIAVFGSRKGSIVESTLVCSADCFSGVETGDIEVARTHVTAAQCAAGFLDVRSTTIAGNLLESGAGCGVIAFEAPPASWFSMTDNIVNVTGDEGMLNLSPVNVGHTHVAISNNTFRGFADDALRSLLPGDGHDYRVAYNALLGSTERTTPSEPYAGITLVSVDGCAGTVTIEGNVIRDTPLTSIALGHINARGNPVNCDVGSSDITRNRIEVKRGSTIDILSSHFATVRGNVISGGDVVVGEVDELMLNDNIFDLGGGEAGIGLLRCGTATASGNRVMNATFLGASSRSFVTRSNILEQASLLSGANSLFISDGDVIVGGRSPLSIFGPDEVDPMNTYQARVSGLRIQDGRELPSAGYSAAFAVDGIDALSARDVSVRGTEVTCALIAGVRSVDVEDLKLFDCKAAGLAVGSSTGAIDSVEVGQTARVGVLVEDSQLTLNEVSITDVAMTRTGLFGDGLVIDGGSVHVRQLDVTEAARAGILVNAGRLSLDDTCVISNASLPLVLQAGGTQQGWERCILDGMSPNAGDVSMGPLEVP